MIHILHGSLFLIGTIITLAPCAVVGGAVWLVRENPDTDIRGTGRNARR